MGIAMQELLALRGIESDHIAIRTSSYHAIDQQDSTVQVFSLSYLVKKISADDRLLIVDDVYDTGRSIDTIIDRLQQLTRRNMPQDVRVAVPYYKPTRNQTNRVPDYYLGLTPEEVRKHRPQLASILSEAKSSPFK